ncbi:MAG: M16 family metallopeptidase [Candidatus Saccharibacteria bacterium]
MIVTRNLANGARVVMEEIPHVRSAAIGVFVKIGSRHETEESNGISHFLEHMIFKGTSTRTAREIAEQFEEMGGQLNAYTSKEYTCYYARVLDENINDAMDVLFDMLFNSHLNEKELDTERGVILEEINMYEDSPDELVHDVFNQTILVQHPLGRPILGTSEKVSAITQETIYKYYRSYYKPQNMIIAVAGNIKSDEIIARLEKYNGFDPGQVGIITDGGQPVSVQGINLVSKETEQVQICLGVPSISYMDDRRYTQNIMNSILGGGMSSRLFQKLREEKGLAYSVYSYSSTYRDTGTYVIYIGTSPGKVEEFFGLLGDELKDFADNGATEEELERTKKQMKASMYLGLESIMARMTRLGKSEMFYGKIVPVEEIMDKIYAVTPAMIRDFAAETLGGSQFTLASIGEASVLPKVEEEFRKIWPLN